MSIEAYDYGVKDGIDSENVRIIEILEEKLVELVKNGSRIGAAELSDLIDQIHFSRSSVPKATVIKKLDRLQERSEILSMTLLVIRDQINAADEKLKKLEDM